MKSENVDELTENNVFGFFFYCVFWMLWLHFQQTGSEYSVLCRLYTVSCCNAQKIIMLNRCINFKLRTLFLISLSDKCKLILKMAEYKVITLPVLGNFTG